MHISHTETVCLVDDQTLAQRAAYWAANWGTRGSIMEDLWRQINFHVTVEGVRLEMGSHNAACNYRAGVVKHFLAWEDLDDVQTLHALLTHEQFCVAHKVLSMLQELRDGRLALRRALSTTFGSSTALAPLTA